MATPTTYRSYLKPATGETYDVSLLDSNYDKIDADVNTALTGGGTVKIKHAEFTSTTASQTSGAGVNFGTMTADGAKTVNNTFVTMDNTGKATFNEVGVYECYAKASPASSYTAMQLWAFDGTGTQQLSETSSGYGGLPFSANCKVYVDTVGQTLQFGATWNATSAANCRVKITKVQG